MNLQLIHSEVSGATINRQTNKVKSAKPLINDSLNITKFVQFVENNHNNFNHALSMGTICENFNIKRRVLYDFISILSRFDICSKVSNEQFLWYGLSRAKNAIQMLKNNVELNPDIVMKNDLDCTTDPSLPHIAVGLIELFFYLNVKLLDLRQACSFLATDQKKYKTLLRKLYTIAARLEVVNIVERTINVAEIRLNYPAEQIHALSIEQLVNTREELKAECVYSARRKFFENIVVGKTQKSLSALPSLSSFSPISFAPYTSDFLMNSSSLSSAPSSSPTTSSSELVTLQCMV